MEIQKQFQLKDCAFSTNIRTKGASAPISPDKEQLGSGTLP
jgi:hypothetical protein